MPRRIKWRTLDSVNDSRSAASCTINSSRSCRSPSRYTPIPRLWRKDRTRITFQLLFLPVRRAPRFRCAAIDRSDMRRASSRIRGSVSVSMVHRVCPCRFLRTACSVWSPPFQCKRSRAAAVAASVLSLRPGRARSRSESGAINVTIPRTPSPSWWPRRRTRPGPGTSPSCWGRRSGRTSWASRPSRPKP